MRAPYHSSHHSSHLSAEVVCSAKKLRWKFVINTSYQDNREKIMKRVNKNNDRFSKWGDAKANFRSLTVLGDLATRFIRENHPLFAQATIKENSKSNLVSNPSGDQLNDGEAEVLPARRGRPRKSNQFFDDYEEQPYYSSRKKHTEDNNDAQNDDGQRRKRNVGIPRHFENMVMIEQKRKRFDGREREREDDDTNSIQAFDAVNEAPKRKRGRPSKTREQEQNEHENPPAPAATSAPSKPQPAIHTTEEVSSGPKRLTFPEFCEQMRDFFRVLGAWYGVSAPVILHYLREQILPVLRVLSATQLPKETIAELYDQISRTLSYREIAPSFLSLLSIGRGFPFYAAIVHTLKIYDPDNLYGMRSMHYFVEPPPIQVITIYLRKVVEALNSPNGRETFKEIATIMDEIITEWKDYSIPLEKRLEKIVKIDQLLPDHCRGLRARLYHVLMLPTTIMSKVLLQQQLLDEGHVLSTADNMVGPAEARIFYTVGHESLKETGIVPSGIPNTVLFNNVAYIKPVTVHPALATVTALGVAGRVEQPVAVVNRIYNQFPTPEAGPMFTTETATTYNTSFGGVPAVTGVITSPPLSSASNARSPLGTMSYGSAMTANSHPTYTAGYPVMPPPYHIYSTNGMYTGVSGAKPSAPTLSANGTLNMTSVSGGYVPNSGRPYAAPAKGALPPPLPLSAHSTSLSSVSADGLMRGDSYGGVALTSVSLGDNQMAPPSQSRCSSATSMSSPDTELDAQHQKEKQMVRAFLERAKETLTDEYMGPFLTAVKELVRTLRKGEYTADDVDAKVMLMQSFVPPERADFRDAIAETFTPANIPPLPARPPSSTGDAIDTLAESASAAGGSSGQDGVQAPALSSGKAKPAAPRDASSSSSTTAPVTSSPMVLPSISQMSGMTSTELPDQGNLLSQAGSWMATTSVTVRPIPVDSASQPVAITMPPPLTAGSVPAGPSFPAPVMTNQPNGTEGSFGIPTGMSRGAPSMPGAMPTGAAQGYVPPQQSTPNGSNTGSSINWSNISPVDVGASAFANAPPSTFGYDPSVARFKASDAAATKLTQLQQRNARAAAPDTSVASTAAVTAASASASTSATATSSSSGSVAVQEKSAGSAEAASSASASAATASSSTAGSSNGAAHKSASSSSEREKAATGKPIVLNGVTFPYTPYFSYPTMPNSVFTNATAAELLGGEPVFEGTNASHATGRRAAIAAGPQTPGEDKTLQLNKAIAFFFDVNSTNYELSLTVLSEKFRVSHGKIKSTLQKEIEERINSWSDEVCNKLDDALNYYTTRNRKGTHVTLAKAAAECHVPHFHLLVWYIKVKASVNRFRTKPGDFKAKLSEMFIAYYKAEGMGIPESRAAISRRFMMTPALFSRKLMDLSDEQRQEYSSIAAKQLQEERSVAALAAASAIYAPGGGSSASASASTSAGSSGVSAEEILASREGQSSGSGASNPAPSLTSHGPGGTPKSYVSALTGPRVPAGASGSGSTAHVGNVAASGRKGHKAAGQALSAADYVAHTVAVSIANEEKRRSFAAMQGRSRNKGAK